MKIPYPCIPGRLIIVLSMAAIAAPLRAASVKPLVGYLQPRDAKLHGEADAAFKLCAKLGTALPLRFAQGGKLVDASGEDAKPLPAVIWIHAGDSTDLTPLVPDSQSSEALLAYVKKGGGLYVSGAALALVNTMGIEPIRARCGGPGHDGNRAELVPVVPHHPVFKGLTPGGDRIPLSDAGFPAFADWHSSGGPRKGMVLAKSPGGSENPLAEFAYGKGRVIAMGWRLPHYAHQANSHARNLQRLTANILDYLADRKKWLEVVPWRGSAKPRVPEQAPDWEALELAIRDLADSFTKRYPGSGAYLAELGQLRAQYEGAAATPATGRDEVRKRFRALQRTALLANPLLDFARLLVIKRAIANLGLPTNYQGNCSLRGDGYDNALVTLDLRAESPELEELYRPEKSRFIGDVDLSHSARKMLVSMPGTHGRWQIHEIGVDGTHLRELPLIVEADIDNYDACYLPDGNIIFSSTATFTGVPCVRGGSYVANLYLYNATGDGSIRRLTFDQEHNWCPTVLNNGRVMYLRWEYSDIPHYVARILFHMNPDGTEQMEYYGSNSYWPNAMFYARPVPDHPTRFVAIVGGHHGIRRMGELVLFDPALGRFEADGVVQRIPGRGDRVEPVILDNLVNNSWPKFLHPWPLSSSHFLVAAQPTKNANWGLYLADVFDNMVLIKEEPGYALLEPIPLNTRKLEPVVSPKVDTADTNGLVYIADVYTGPGLEGIPRGTVREFRLFTYHFSYRGMGGQVDRVGLDGPWDVKRVMGTVPVQPDGSAYFRVPANTPISLQPLDAEGKALQLMRSWMTAMPGETLSCVGCHESQNTPPPTRQTMAQQRPPDAIKPWYGPTRGFSFVREVQPVLDAHCVRCHDGKQRPDGCIIPNFTARPLEHPPGRPTSYQKVSRFTPSYLALRRFVRSTTIESDMHLLPPCEFHADTSELIQKLRAGHSGVQLDREAWDRLITWIDLGTPAHGTWHENCGWDRVRKYRDRRRDLLARYANIDEDPEAITPPSYKPATTAPSPSPAVSQQHVVRPVPPAGAPSSPRERTLDLGDGVSLVLCEVPGRGYWIGKYEVTNEQFAEFDPDHDSRLEHGDFLQFSATERGYPMNAPEQPVVRVSWNRAMAFCRWLSETTGENVTLPTGDEWEDACRAGTTTDMSYGAVQTNFSAHANLADKRLLHVDTFGWSLPSGAVYPWRPAIAAVDDGHRVSAPVGTYQPNALGLHDVHGNVAEWTSDAVPGDRMVTRGGSWYRRPLHATASSRTPYHPWQGVFDVGFRVVCR